MFFSRDAEVIARLQRLEQKLDRLLAHFQVSGGHDVVAGADDGAALDMEVRRLAENGLKIDAIKRQRELTGMGLKEAKDAVEAHLAGRR